MMNKMVYPTITCQETNAPKVTQKPENYKQENLETRVK